MLKNVDSIMYISEADWIPRDDGICVMTCWSANQLKRKKAHCWLLFKVYTKTVTSYQQVTLRKKTHGVDTNFAEKKYDAKVSRQS